VPSVVLRVADDGVGIRPEQLDKRAEGHLGLRLLIDRIADQGGELRIEARPEGGTVALARMPAEGLFEPGPASPTASGRNGATPDTRPAPPNSGGSAPSPAAAPSRPAHTD
jgi:hypothetical protein